MTFLLEKNLFTLRIGYEEIALKKPQVKRPQSFNPLHSLVKITAN